MNCDQAFDALTDNNLRGSNELIQHLDACPRCQDMADMLDPALNLFDDVLETSVEFESSAPTDNFGNEYSDSAELSPTSEHAPSTRPSTAKRPWLHTASRRAASQRDGFRVAAFLILIAVMMAAMVNVERGGRNDAVTIALPDDCQRSANTDSSSDNVVTGCVACHLNATSLADLRPVQRIHAKQLVQRCVSCHLNMTTGEYLAEVSNVAHGQPVRADDLQLAACLFGRGGNPSQL